MKRGKPADKLCIFGDNAEGEYREKIFKKKKPKQLQIKGKRRK